MMSMIAGWCMLITAMLLWNWWSVLCLAIAFLNFYNAMKEDR